MSQISEGPGGTRLGIRNRNTHKIFSPWTGLGRDFVNILIASDTQDWVSMITMKDFGYATKGILRRFRILQLGICHAVAW